MSRYGRFPARGQSSYYSSITVDVPTVTDEDFSYITSQDLEHDTLSRKRSKEGDDHAEDDTIFLEFNGKLYTARFPAYTIADGRLDVQDVRDRAALLLNIPDGDVGLLRLMYKGQPFMRLSDSVRDYGVKNKSEITVLSPDSQNMGKYFETMSIFGENNLVEDSKVSGRKRKNHKKGGDAKGDADSASSPRDGTPEVDGTSPVPGAMSMRKLRTLAQEFYLNLRPLCEAYIVAPPKHEKTRHDEYKRLEETVLQNVIMKLDAIDAEGVAEVRMRRKELVRAAQDILKRLDAAKTGSTM